MLEFVRDHPTLRVVLTCRRQNFRAIRGDWVPVLSEETYTLAPLKDDEIRAFIARREREFSGDRTPADLYSSIAASGTLELHRVPLILTISIGLYIRLQGYRIPTSLTAFYEEMIKQLLIRHDFRLETAGSVNRFAADDKLRFLKDFAHWAATREGQFEDFNLADLVQRAELQADQFPSLPRGQGEAFVSEIVDRSGLVVQASMTDEYVFAHRSVQEFLIASWLLRSPQVGVDGLVARVADPAWRLVAIFFAAFDHDFVDPFLRALRPLNLELCGHCMAASRIADRSLATEVIDALQFDVIGGTTPDDVSQALASLIALSNSALPWLRVAATRTLLSSLRGQANAAVTDLLGLDQDATARLIAGLAQLDDLDAVTLMARISALPTAETVANIRPVWRTFWAFVDLHWDSDPFAGLAALLLRSAGPRKACASCRPSHRAASTSLRSGATRSGTVSTLVRTCPCSSAPASSAASRWPATVCWRRSRTRIRTSTRWSWTIGGGSRRSGCSGLLAS